jgi:hypothetical protein
MDSRWKRLKHNELIRARRWDDGSSRARGKHGFYQSVRRVVQNTCSHIQYGVVRMDSQRASVSAMNSRVGGLAGLDLMVLSLIGIGKMWTVTRVSCQSAAGSGDAERL